MESCLKTIFYLLLSNEDTVLLHAKANYAEPTPEASKYIARKYYHHLENSYEINPGQLNKLKNSDISSVRMIAFMPTGSVWNFDEDVPEKKKSGLKELIACVEL
jgi:hypothetical protein